ncbi:MAG TPA: helix-turn-helix domain-containing protein [Pseudonocardiaceae bacterium]|nr:helix-turn-helix domain-containing protein [Pseudonocardiaceae bacterium]
MARSVAGRRSPSPARPGRPPRRSSRPGACRQVGLCSCASVPVALSGLRGAAARPVPGRERSGRPVCWAGRGHANRSRTARRRRRRALKCLGVPVKTLYQCRYQGNGPVAKRMGRYIRYRPADVVAWFESLDDKSAAWVGHRCPSALGARSGDTRKGRRVGVLRPTIGTSTGRRGGLNASALPGRRLSVGWWRT